MSDRVDTPDPDQSSFSRRTFLAAAGAALRHRGARGHPRRAAGARLRPGRQLHIVRWVDFIPEADVELKRQAPEASKALGAEVTFEFINANDLQPRITAAIQSGSGADIFQMLWNWPHLYANALIDVSDVAEPIGKTQGGFYEAFDASPRWAALARPSRTGVGGNAIAYRRSWHAEIGVTEFPKTWDAWREVGKKLKAKGKPVGQALGHSFGDPAHIHVSPALELRWGRDRRGGKKVTINSKGTLEPVKFMQAFWKDACDEGGLAWDDTNNNRAFHAGELSATLNGASIYIVAKRQEDKIKDDKGEPLWPRHRACRAAPGRARGAAALYLPFEHGIMEHSRNQKLGRGLIRVAAPEGELREVVQVNEGYRVGATRNWEEHPMWRKVDKPLRLPVGPSGGPGCRLTRARPPPGPPWRTRSTWSWTCSPRPLTG